LKIPKIKICGLTTPQEAAWCLEENVNYTGMVVFFEKSKRNVTISRAKELLAVLHETGETESVKAVAVTVSPTAEQVHAIQEAGFDMIQVHGELSKEAFDAIEIPMIRAFNGCDRELYEKYHHCEKVAAYLFDAKVPGSGETFDWSELKQIPRDEKLFFLAGGLHPDNISEAIRQVQPDVVDVSSGVELAPDVVGKDREKIRAFVRNVRDAAESSN
jgi:phosphoribosylanthranilate isomerase